MYSMHFCENNISIKKEIPPAINRGKVTSVEDGHFGTGKNKIRSKCVSIYTASTKIHEKKLKGQTFKVYMFNIDSSKLTET